MGPNMTYPGLQLKFATSPSDHFTWDDDDDDDVEEEEEEEEYFPSAWDDDDTDIKR